MKACSTREQAIDNATHEAIKQAYKFSRVRVAKLVKGIRAGRSKGEAR